ncbi:MAG TPA: hypothetical protein VL595_18505 [Pseudonocardia sp.]|jgi:multidrug efflux pump subunit AcrA (membrane-fusion protein)|nr:hypothetical protein [Pseudonocardia sp.]
MATRAGRALLASLFVVPVASGCGSDVPTTVPVVMGTVTSGVSASGILRYVNEQKIGFPQGGVLAALKVKVGDRVAVGQPVAEVENLEQRTALRKAQDQARIEQLKLDQANASNKSSAAATDAKDAGKELDAARRSLDESIKRGEDSIKQRDKRLDFDRNEVDRFQHRLSSDRPCLQDDSDLITPGVQPSQECIDRLRADRDNIKTAQAAVIQDREDLKDARDSLDVEKWDRKVTVAEKQRGHNAAGNTQVFETTDRPFNIEVQRLTLDAANADLQNAQKAYQDTIKPSSYSGIVDHINGRVGQVLAASYSKPAPGAAPVSGPSGADLIVLKDVNAYQVVVPFSEANGARITPDKTVEVTFDEIPGLIGQARIASIEAPAADAKSKTYMVTVVLNQNDPRLKDGLHARATVALDKVDNTLVVPASAVVVNGRTGMVSLQQQDGTRRDVSVELGMVGERMIEILSGVRENDQVVADHNT